MLCFSLSDARPPWLLGCGMKELLPLAGEVDRLLLADAALFSWEPEHTENGWLVKENDVIATVTYLVLIKTTVLCINFYLPHGVSW